MTMMMTMAPSKKDSGNDGNADTNTSCLQENEGDHNGNKKQDCDNDDYDQNKQT